MQLSSSNSLLVIDQLIGFDRATREPMYQKQVDPLFEQKQKLINRKSKLMKLMVGDRQEKYKKEAALKQKPATDASSQMSSMREKLRQLESKLNHGAIEAEILSPEDWLGTPEE
jgi:hypothetical protein